MKSGGEEVGERATPRRSDRPGLAALCVATLLVGVPQILLSCRDRDGQTPGASETGRVGQIIAIVHGVGNQRPGYSDPMQALLRPRLVDGDFVEVVWSDLGTFLARAGPESPALRSARQDWERDLAEQEAQVLALPSRTVRSDRVREEYAAARGYVGPILQYEFLSKEERRNIQARLREALEKAALRSESISLVAHSLGSVIAFDVLHGWEGSTPGFEVRFFLTLGSPLKRGVFLGHNGRPRDRPPAASQWANVYSPWDPISSKLAPDYGGPRDVEIETSVLPLSAHSAYWTHEKVIGLFMDPPPRQGQKGEGSSR